MSGDDLDLQDLVTDNAETKTEAADASTEQVLEQVIDETEPQQEVTETPAPTIDTVTVDAFVTSHSSKLSGVTKANLTVPNIAAGKYNLFATVVEAGAEAEMFLMDDTDRLVLQEFNPDSVVVVKSGLIAKSGTRRTYVTKTNTTQFDLDGNSVPTVMRNIRKKSVSGEVKFDDTAKEDNSGRDLDYVKIKVKSIIPPLGSSVEEMTDKNDIRAAVITFMDSVKDINYLIKIEKQVLMACF